MNTRKSYLPGIYFALIIFVILITFNLYKNTSILNVSTEQVIYKEGDVLALLKEFKDNLKANNNAIGQPIKANGRFDFLAKYPTFQECTDPSYKKWTSQATATKHQHKNYSLPADKDFSSRAYTRAVLLYFPIKRTSHFLPEFKWLYRSWIEMQKSEPVMWRTDLILFIENDPEWFKLNTFLEELNCNFSNIRHSKDDLPMCTLIPYVALKDRKIANRNFTSKFIAKEKYQEMLSDFDIFSDVPEKREAFYALAKDALKDYGYVDSILMAFDGYQYFESAGYDFLVRSDMDVFLTPLFAKWLPHNCNDFYVGHGAYSVDFNRRRLARVAEDLGLEYAWASNLGSTWYSTPKQFRLVSYLTVFMMAYLGKEEFTESERKGKMLAENWPEWHYGVLLLYGQHVCLNHLIGSKQLNVIPLDNLLDFPADKKGMVKQKLHIHVFHSNKMFSKFDFKDGRYDNMTVKGENMEMVKVYCLRMALDSKRSSNNDLKLQLETVIDAKKTRTLRK